MSLDLFNNLIECNERTISYTLNIDLLKFMLIYWTFVQLSGKTLFLKGTET